MFKWLDLPVLQIGHFQTKCYFWVVTFFNLLFTQEQIQKPILLSYPKTATPFPAYHFFFLKKADICHFSLTGFRFHWHKKCCSSWVTEYFEFHSKVRSIMGWSFYTSEVCSQLFSPAPHFLRASAVRGIWTSLDYTEQCLKPTPLSIQLQSLHDWHYRGAPVKRVSTKERGVQNFAEKFAEKVLKSARTEKCGWEVHRHVGLKG